MNKRGISAIVATVLLILITVAAVAIVWGAIIPLITGGMSSGTLCLEAMGQIGLGSDARYTCWNNESGAENVSLEIIRRVGDFELADIQVLISAGGNTASFSLVDDVTTLSPSGMTVGDLPAVNEKQVYVIDATSISGEVDAVSIAPVMAIGNVEETCGVLSTVSIKQC